MRKSECIFKIQIKKIRRNEQVLGRGNGIKGRTTKETGFDSPSDGGVRGLGSIKQDLDFHFNLSHVGKVKVHRRC